MSSPLKKYLNNNYHFNKDLNYPQGFFARSFHSGLKKKDPDMSILYSPTPLVINGSFTQNKCRANVIEDTLKKLTHSGSIKCLVVFAGNANAITGNHAKQTIQALEKSLAEILNLKPTEIIFSFTGVVGREFPYVQIIKNIKKNKANICQALHIELPKISPTKTNSHKLLQKETGKFSHGILTTDTSEKTIATELNFKQGKIRISGCAKGSGMIYPNMATMLAYITTDIAISRSQLKKLHSKINQLSFNSINIDNETSTNDTFLIISNGAATVRYRQLSAKEKTEFTIALTNIARGLAQKIVLDGEGATKFITITVKNCHQKIKAEKIAKTISSSLLLKTALFGNDANYGRILVALGNSNTEININKIKLFFGKILLFSNNKVKMEKITSANQYLKKNKTIEITIDLNEGKEQYQIYTCDLSYQYVKINAEYTT